MLYTRTRVFFTLMILFLLAMAPVGLFLLSVVDPYEYNQSVAAPLGLPEAEEPVVNLGGCELGNGEVLTFTGDEWTVSNGCTPVEEYYNGEHAVRYTNYTYHTLALVGTSAHVVQTTVDCVWLIGELTGIILHPDCSSLLIGDKPASWRLYFDLQEALGALPKT